MKKANFTSSASVWGALLIFVTALFMSANVSAQCTLVCNDLVQISLDEDCSVELNADMILEGGGCPNGNLQVQAKVNGIWQPAVGNFVVTSAYLNQTLQVRVRDLNSSNLCWGNMHVEDKLAPALTCHDLTLSCAISDYTPDYLLNELDLGDAYPEVDENCGPYTLTRIDTWVDLACNASFNGVSDLSGYVKRIWTATDPSGNYSTCTQYLYFKRIHIGQVKFPADVTVSCSNPSTSPDYTGAPYVTSFGHDYSLYPNNTLCEMQATYSDQLLPICDGTYKILRTWTVVDWCLPTTPVPPTTNPTYYIQLIKVSDSAGPLVDCPDDLTVGTNPYDCERDLNLPDVIITDNCSRIKNIRAEWTINGVGYTLDGTLTSFPGNNLWNPDTLGVLGTANNLPLGVTKMKYIVTDDCGNSTTCEFDITVEDDTPPASVCVEYTQVSLGSNGMIFVNATSFDKGSYDNCSQVAFKVRRMNSNACQPNNRFYDQVKFCCEDIGDTIQVILRVYDVPVQAGEVALDYEELHSNDCMVQVYVDDKLKPICQAPANVTVSCENFDPSLWAYGQATATDNCCIDTITTTASYTQFDTLCNKGTITRTFRAIDCGGLSSQCTQRIVVQYKQDYYVKFPDDKIVTICNGDGIYDVPTFFNKDCELMGVSYEDEIFTVVVDACFKIERTWRIINWCTYNTNLPCVIVPNPTPNATSNHPTNLPGPVVSKAGTPAPWAPTVVKINSTDATATNYSIFYDPNANCYQYKQIIKIIDGQKPTTDCPASPVEICDLTANDPLFWNQSYWWDNTIGSHDLCEAPSDICVTATDACSGANVNIEYLLFLDLDGDNSMETVISSTNLPGFNNVQYGNANTPNFAGGTPRAFDGRPVLQNQKYGFSIQETVNGKNKTACVKWNTLQSPNSFVTPQLPHGNHKIKWIVTDGCGNETVCEYQIKIRDCKAPTVVCKNGLSVNIMPVGMITLWASDFLQYTEDNCTPADQLKIAIRKSGTGTGFPVDANGDPITSVTFTCDEIGTQPVELWSQDAAAPPNASYCETYVIVQDPDGACTPGVNASVAGAAKMDFNVPTSGVQDAQMKLSGDAPNGLPPVSLFSNTNNQGSYNFNAIPVLGTYLVTPTKTDNPLNGVTTYDLVLINRHILGLQPLDNPLKMIAADANKSNSITTFDIVEFRKLILGIYDELPGNTSWRFVKKDFPFTNPSNPFEDQWPESYEIQQLTSAGMNSADFGGIKVGDVNGSATPNNLVSTDDRSAGTLFFDLQNRKVAAGEEVVVNFKANEKTLGYQFTLNFNGLEVVQILPGENMSTENFAVFTDKNAITTSVDGDALEFAVKFRATQAGELSKMLNASSRITPAAAYVESGSRYEVALRFNDGNGAVLTGDAFQLFQNTPNPLKDATNISFNLPEATSATLTVTNAEGRVIKVVKGSYAKGLNTVTLNRAELAAGILFYQLDTPGNSAVKKMVVVD